jgi:hypothetical protein
MHMHILILTQHPHHKWSNSTDLRKYERRFDKEDREKEMAKQREEWAKKVGVGTYMKCRYLYEHVYVCVYMCRDCAPQYRIQHHTNHDPNTTTP